ncbi:hypothetical protein BVRB_1g007690 [Beta vulgaris subsp. vulgaris]|uniref:uncharacterized protein LOC104891201 n=1 Tax=Beta vulgaris subsp. vulgaris TaxID=3555 RepID=UPI00054001FE|nr:uncharacterized protein LOC104891201 [Beta vulgaris subsp. vulgaris]KMT19714.1 hypothetical protein BVRB_1g007690 [Beta vulgaris subsp. vulgaris]
MNQSEIGETSCQDAVSKDGSVEITCFSDDLYETTVHFQIINLHKQIYVWIGCNSAKLGPLCAAGPTRPNNTVSVTSILGSTSDNAGFGFARRLVLRTGLNIILACNLPKDNPMLEIGAEKKLVEKLISLGYTKPRSKDLPHS